MAKKTTSPTVPRDTTVFSLTDLDNSDFLALVKRRANEAENHWEKEEHLKDNRAANNKAYLGKYVEEKLRDERYEDIYLDNRQFTSVRTIVPFLSARITQCEIVPADDTDIAKFFAQDFEKSLVKQAQKQYGRAKIRMSIEDLLRGERIGVLKWRYDAVLDTLVLEHCEPGSVVVGKRAKQYEEPDLVRHKQKRTVNELIGQFPHRKKLILDHFKIASETTYELDKEYNINEDWIWIDSNGKKQLVVGWSHLDFLFDKIPDPNWVEDGKNVADRSMAPFIFFNFLNNGRGYVDQTSFIEQAKYLQSNYNKRGQTIADNAKYAGIGVPIFAKGSISQKDVAKVRFSPIQRILLNTTDIRTAFTTWQAGQLPQFIVEDKYDDRSSIDNIWGTNSIIRGQSSDNKTATQDVINRNQAEGRLADPVDRIDDAMRRFYIIESQLMYRYFDEDKYYKFVGGAGKFVKVIISQKRIAANFGIEIDVTAGSSLPIDRAQKRATVMQLLQLNKVGTLTAYKELNIFDDPDQAFKEYILEQTDPNSLIKDAESAIFDRDAEEDLADVIGGKTPDERDDVGDEYLAYLNEYLITDKYKHLKPAEQQRVSKFVDAVVAQARRKMIKLSMQVNPEPGAQTPPGQPQPEQAPGMQPMPTAPGMATAIQQQQPTPQPQPSMAGALSGGV